MPSVSTVMGELLGVRIPVTGGRKLRHARGVFKTVSEGSTRHRSQRNHFDIELNIDEKRQIYSYV